VLAPRKYFSFSIALEQKAESTIETAIGTMNSLIPESIERIDKSQQEIIDKASVAVTVCLPSLELPYNFDIFASVLNTYEHPYAK
jgi:hypothetical protein